MQISRVGQFTLGWGESLLWDEVRQRLYFVDCATSDLHWLDEGETEPTTLQMPTMLTGIVATPDGRLVGVLDDGLSVIDPDTGAVNHLTDYPTGFEGRCNDACADTAGNLITGELNLGPADGSSWRWSAKDGWSLLDDDIANTNGPAVGVIDGETALIIGDTSAAYYSYPYDLATGAAGTRSVFGDTSDLDGAPDGSTLDREGGLWTALVGGGQLARFTSAGLDRTVALDAGNPTDVTFGGAGLDRLFVVSISGEGDLDGALLVIDGLDAVGRVEPRVDLG